MDWPSLRVDLGGKFGFLENLGIRVHRSGMNIVRVHH